jgi:formylglycine-generating enzyme required for sulfatase activity
MTKLLLKRKNHTARYFREQVNGVPLDMILIPGNSFIMGSPDNELGREKSESPQHPVTVSSFCMGKYPITQAQWQAIAATNPNLPNNPAKCTGDDARPVENVSWQQATEFCATISQLTNRDYRLPFHFGETITTDFANYAGSKAYGLGSTGIYHEKTTAVGIFYPNAFGLYDMHGNVWEWCQDHWHDNYEGAPTDGTAWLNKNNDNHLLRGGSWYDISQSCRSADRYFNSSDYRVNHVGFRVVCGCGTAKIL